MGASKVVLPPVSSVERHETLRVRVDQVLNSRAWGVQAECVPGGLVRVWTDSVMRSWAEIVMLGVREQLASVRVPGDGDRPLFSLSGEELRSQGYGGSWTWSVKVGAVGFTPTRMTDAEVWELREQADIWLPGRLLPGFRVVRREKTAMLEVEGPMSAHKADRVGADLRLWSRRMGFAMAHQGVSVSGVQDRRRVRVIVTRVA